jgi:hypothetical protein
MITTYRPWKNLWKPSILFHLKVVQMSNGGWYPVNPQGCRLFPKSTAPCCCPKPGSLRCQTSQSYHLKAGSSMPTNPWKSRWRFPWGWCRKWSTLTEAVILQEIMITITCLSSPILRLLVLYEFIRFNLDFFFLEFAAQSKLNRTLSTY